MDSRVYLRGVLGVIIVCAACSIVISCSPMKQPAATNSIEGTPTWSVAPTLTKETPTIQAFLANTPTYPIPAPSNTRVPTHLPTAETPASTSDLTMTQEPTSLAPCGRHIAFQSTHSDVASIALVDVCSQQVTWLTDGTKYAESPQWSPDGRNIAFLARAAAPGGGDYRDLCLIDIQTHAITQLTHGIKIESGGPFAWSPNGQEILFSSESEHYEGYVQSMILRVSDGVVRTLPDGLAGPFSWSPDGLEIALAMDEDLFNGATPDESVIRAGLLVITQPDGQVIAGNQEHGSYPLYSSRSWLWSPENQRVAVAEWPMARGDGGDIRLIEIEGQELVVRARLQDLMPSVKDLIVHSLAWSPTGDEIAFVLVSPDHLDITIGGQVYVADRNFTRIRTITPEGIACAGVEWAPDGSQLVFVCDDGPPKASLWLVNPDGTGLHRITKPEEGTGYPGWQPVLAP